MNNTKKLIIHTVILFTLGYLWLNNFFLAPYILSIYMLALFFEAKVSAYCLLFFIFLLPFFVYNNEKGIAEHYAISAYIFLSGAVLYILARRNKFLEDFFAISYSQLLLLATGEKIFKEEDFSAKFDKMMVYIVPLLIFAFLLLSPIFNFLLIDNK